MTTSTTNVEAPKWATSAEEWEDNQDGTFARITRRKFADHNGDPLFEILETQWIDAETGELSRTELNVTFGAFDYFVGDYREQVADCRELAAKLLEAANLLEVCS